MTAMTLAPAWRGPEQKREYEVVIAGAGGHGQASAHYLAKEHGVRAAGEADAVLIALADMPWIRPDTFCAVAAALARGEQVVVPRHQGQRGHPVGFGRAHFPALLLLGDDQGARDVIARATGICWIDVDDPGVLRDVDVPGDLEAHRS